MYDEEMIEKFWNEITLFEIGERKNESQNILLSEARAGARMEAYVNLFYYYVFERI